MLRKDIYCLIKQNGQASTQTKLVTACYARVKQIIPYIEYYFVCQTLLCLFLPLFVGWSGWLVGWLVGWFAGPILLLSLGMMPVNRMLTFHQHFVRLLSLFSSIRLCTGVGRGNIRVMQKLLA